jgi:hypothetical protein
MFGLVFFLLRDVLFGQTYGWAIIWITLVFVGIFSTFAPAPASVEGFVYMKPGSARNWGGTVEILCQSLLLSVITFYWVNHPEIGWLTWVLGILFLAVLVLPALSLLGMGKRTTATQAKS